MCVKLTPLLKAHKNGSFKFTRAPTLKDAEFIYRLIRDLGGKYKREGANDAAADNAAAADTTATNAASEPTRSFKHAPKKKRKDDEWEKSFRVQQALEGKNNKIQKLSHQVDSLKRKAAKALQGQKKAEKGKKKAEQEKKQDVLEHRRDQKVGRALAIEQ